MEEPLLNIYLNGPFSPQPAEKRVARLVEEGQKKLHECLKVLHVALQGKEYLVGNQFSAADIMIVGALTWAAMLGAMKEFPELQAYADRCVSRPAYKRANAD